MYRQMAWLRGHIRDRYIEKFSYYKGEVSIGLLSFDALQNGLATTKYTGENGLVVAAENGPVAWRATGSRSPGTEPS